MGAERVLAGMAGVALLCCAVAFGIVAALPRTPGAATAVLAVLAALMAAVAVAVAREYGPRRGGGR